MKGKKKWLIALIAAVTAVVGVLAPPLAVLVEPVGALVLGLDQPEQAPEPATSAS